jgi:hypothetical protein
MYPTIRSALCRDTATDYPFCSTLSVDYTSDYPIYRLSMLHGTIRSTLASDTVTDYPLCSTLSVDYTSDYPIYRLSMLYPTIRSALCRDTATDHPLCFTQSTVVSLATLQLTIRSALPVDIQLCSTLSGDDTSDYLLYSTLLCLSVC